MCDRIYLYHEQSCGNDAGNKRGIIQILFKNIIIWFELLCRQSEMSETVDVIRHW